MKRTIALLGWAIDSLRLVDSSRATVGRHDQRSFTWEPLSPAPALIVGTDTAKRVIEATFVDGALTRYRARVLLPASATARADRKSTISATVIGALIAVLVLVLAVDLVRARRARTLRFERALRLGTATALLLTIGLIIGSRRSAGEFGVTFRPEDAAVGAVIGQYALLLLIIAPFAFLFATLVAAAAESVAIRRAPELLAGYQVVVAMPRPRRLATYLPAGTAFGLGVAGLAALCAGAGAWLSGAPLGVGVSEIQTLADSIVQVGMSVALAPIAVLLVVLIVAHARAAGRLVGDVTSAVVVAALAGGLDFIASSNVPDSASAAAIAGGLALVVQRRGLVEGAIAFAVLELARAFIDAYLEPFAERWPPGIALGAMLVMAIGAMLVTPRRSAGTQSTSGAS